MSLLEEAEAFCTEFRELAEVMGLPDEAADVISALVAKVRRLTDAGNELVDVVIAATGYADTPEVVAWEEAVK